MNMKACSIITAGSERMSRVASHSFATGRIVLGDLTTAVYNDSLINQMSSVKSTFQL